MQHLSGPVLSLSMIDASCPYTGYVYCGPSLIATYQNAFGKNKHYFLNPITVKCNQFVIESIFRLSF